MKFIAFLKDSLRETMDKKSFWVLSILSLVFVLFCWSISFTPTSPEQALQDTVRYFNRVAWGDRTDFSYRTVDPLQFSVAEVERLGEDAGSFEDGFQFRLTASPPEKFFEAVTLEMALRKKLIKKATEEAPGKDPNTGNYPEPSMEDQIKFLRKRFTENGFPITSFTRAQEGVFAVKCKPIVPQQVHGGHRMGLFFGLTEFHLGGTSVSAAMFLAEYIITQWVAGLAGVLCALIFTAFFVPSMLEKGNIEVLLSKPISRIMLLVYKFLGGLLYVFILSIVLLGGSWLGLSVRSGYWNWHYLWSIPIMTFYFAILYAVSVLFGVLWRNWIGSVLMTALMWGVCSIVGLVYDVVHSPAIVVRVSPGILSLTNAVHFVFPKTYHLSELNKWLLAKSNLGETFSDSQPEQALMAGITWELVVFTSVGFILLMLALACWRFTKKDY